jgi:c-di-GMP-binding flagellar brake protein YcgR
MTTTSGSPAYDRRRQFQRIQIRMSAEIHLAGNTFTGTTRDLSEGGVGIEVGKALPEGEEVTLGLFLVVDDFEEERVPPLWVKGRVAWSGELDDGRHMAGIRFEVITDAQKDWLMQVTSHLKHQTP